MTDFETARHNMVESQIRPNDVQDTRVMEAMLEIPRDAFVPAHLKALAYSDLELEIQTASGGKLSRALLSPTVLAKLVQLAEVQPDHLVLDIGCATGYTVAVLARLAEAVVAVESDAQFVERASETLTTLDVDNAAVVLGDLSKGYPEEGPYDVIFFGGAVQEIPDVIFEQLKPDGRLVAVQMHDGVGDAYVYHLVDGNVVGRPHFNASAPMLPGFRRVPTFEF